MNNIKTLVAKFRDHGRKITPQRVAIFKCLQNNRQHPSAEAVFRRIQLDYPGISLTTVYKTLEALRDMGEVFEVYVSGERVFYDPNMAPHSHLICTNCHRILDIPNALPPGFKFPKNVKIKFHVTHHRLDFFGYCGRCKQSV